MRTRWIVGLALVGGIWWMRGDDEEARTTHARVQTAVLSDGFAVLANGRVVEVDRDGAKQHEMKLHVDKDVRVVGTRVGTGIGWQDGKKVKLATLDSDGKPDEVSTWGKRVKQLCQGAATNEHRFGVGWLEADGRVWFVHGPLSRTATAGAAVVLDADPAGASWCAITSAEQNIALVWREGSRLLLNFCGKKECASLVVKVPIDSSDTLLAHGCVRESCLFATRDKHGTTKLHRVTERGRSIVKTLEHATADTAVAIVGAGDRAFAVSYIAKDGQGMVQRVTVDGAITNVWHFDGAQHAPSLAWAKDRLLVAKQSGDVHVVAMPR